MRNGQTQKNKIRTKGSSSYIVKNRLGSNQPKKEVVSEILKVSPSAKEEEIVISIKKLDQKDIDQMKADWKESKASLDKKTPVKIKEKESSVENSKKEKIGHKRTDSDASKGAKNKKGFLKFINFD